MNIKFEDAIVNIECIRRKESVCLFGFEIQPVDGAPYHSGFIESDNAKDAAGIVVDAWRNGNLEVFQKNVYRL